MEVRGCRESDYNAGETQTGLSPVVVPQAGFPQLQIAAPRQFIATWGADVGGLSAAGFG